MQTGDVAFGSLVVAGGDAPPGFQLVDQAFDGVPLPVEVGIVLDGSAAPVPPIPPLAAWSFFSAMTALNWRWRR